ncbi:GerAB/ArcD/ProY family transporter [Cohnella sp. GCM10027633]|uniref:GerAB/ArcD/ProY family transporter n=1 Tax=unclassified Cohnella TaxID=2636738 RepID=UPI00362C6040
MTARPEQLTPFAIGCLLFSFLSGFSTLFLAEAQTLGQDVWMAYAIGLGLSSFMIWLMYRLYSRYPGLSMAEVFDRLLGKPIAKAALVVYLAYMLEIQGAAAQALTSFYRTVVLPNTSSAEILLMIALTTTYAAYLGLGAIARTVLISLPMFLVGIAFIILMILKDVHINPFLPPLRHAAPEIALGGLQCFFFPFGKSIVFCFLFSRTTGGRHTLIGLFAALIASCVYLFVSAYLAFGSLGYRLTANATFPFFSAIQLVKIGEYIERIEIMIIGIWTMFTLFEIIVLQYVFAQVFGSLFGIREVRPFIVPIGLLFFAIASHSFTELHDLVAYNSTIAPFSTLLPMAGIPLALTLVHSLRRR